MEYKGNVSDIIGGGALGALAAWLMRQNKKTILFPRGGDLAVASNASYEIPLPFELTIEEVYVNVKAAPEGGDILIDVFVGDYSIFTDNSHKPFIGDGLSDGNTTQIDIPTWPKNSHIGIGIEQVGSIYPGSDLIVEVRGSAKY